MTTDTANAGGPDGSPRPRVAVIFGGVSSEHAISCLTAGGVLSAIDRSRYEVVGLGITRSGRWIVVDDDSLGQLQVLDGRLPELTENAADALMLRSASGTDLAIRESSALSHLGPVDVAFALLHGPFGEDGTIQGLFEMMGTRYVGAGVLASSVGMDKVFMKLVLSASGLPVVPFVPILPTEWRRDRGACLEAVEALHYPVFVKPARGGSSLGIRRVDNSGGLVAAIEHAQRFDPKVIVEEGVTRAREFECGVLDDLNGGPPKASVVGEIRMHSGFYDFDAKYLPEEQVELLVPAEVEADLAEHVRELAVRTFDALGCEGLARVDMFLTHDRKVIVNEINTMPGFTATSMFPRMWAATGVDYPELIDRLLQLALRRPVGLR
jgi:D-alanine-D-alanine ligase